jgi:cell division transport system permease protein
VNRPEKLNPVRASARPALLPSSDWSAALTIWVAAAMSFLAVLTLAAGLSAVRLADEWRTDLAGVATVRVAPGEGDVEERIAAVVQVLRTTPGIAAVRVLDEAEQAALLAPWLGEGATFEGLPTPRLIDVRIEGGGPDAAALQSRLDLTVEGAVYDDHAAWREPLARAAGALTWLAFAATALVLATAGAMIAYAARATLAANRHVIEVVRLIGGEDRFISAAFVRRLALRAAIGGFAGAAVGCGVLALMPAIRIETGIGLSLAPSAPEWALLGIGLPLAATAVAWVSARAAVRLALRRMP